MWGSMAQVGVILRLNIVIWLLSILIAIELWPVLRTTRGIVVILVVTLAVILYWALYKLE
ncbi:hypothetical protein HALLA_19950 (plasmid) [Halostagnicola larsenii XH-48]|uniref:Uncharacterized protein n=1 Tax=Halostagnicola larsenii XH-48 TaxID=797299 RepID=W0JY97_9EURY|nr:hypothetical protein HALLA_19950 [Halostagnicola larsenii XH-48]